MKPRELCSVSCLTVCLEAVALFDCVVRLWYSERRKQTWKLPNRKCETEVGENPPLCGSWNCERFNHVVKRMEAELCTQIQWMLATNKERVVVNAGCVKYQWQRKQMETKPQSHVTMKRVYPQIRKRLSEPRISRNNSMSPAGLLLSIRSIWGDRAEWKTWMCIEIGLVFLCDILPANSMYLILQPTTSTEQSLPRTHTISWCKYQTRSVAGRVRQSPTKRGCELLRLIWQGEPR